MSNIIQFNFPTTIRFGSEALKEAPLYLQHNSCKNVLIVTDPALAQLPMIATLQALLKAHQIESTIFSELAKNPTEKDVENGVECFKKHHCDSVIGIGGGVSMDAARAIILMVNHSGHVFDYEDGTGNDAQVKADNIPYFIAIPTTSGTGSEVGRSAIISDSTTHQKKVIFAPPLLAKVILADPSLTLSLPKSITAATGIDALVHNVEAYLVDSFHPMCDGIALEGIRLIDQSLLKAINTPDDIEARYNMMAASTMGAVAFQKGLGVVHSLAHALSAFNNMHHGLANALMFTESLRFNQAVCEEKYQHLEHMLKVEDFVTYCDTLITKAGIQTGLNHYGIHESDLDTIAEIALQDTCHLSNPRKVSYLDFVAILKASL